MATLLMVESWVQSTGLRLPPLIRELGHDYVLFTRDPALYPDTVAGPHPVVRDAVEVVVVDTNDRQALTSAVIGLACRRHIEGVLTTCDYYLETAAALAAMLGLPGAPPEVMRLATRKDEVRAALRRAGLPGPRFAVARSWEEALAAAGEVGFPLVAKPVDLNSGTSVRRVDCEAELKDAFWDIVGIERNTRGQELARVVLLEELLRGDEVSVEAVTADGVTTIVGITDKSVAGPPSFVESGHVFPARLPAGAAREVEDHVRQALAAIGYSHGLSHTEVMLTADGPRIVEINPRQGGGYIFDLVHLVTGTNPLEVLVDLALGRPMPASGPAPGAPTNAAVAFVMSPVDGTVVGVDGLGALDADPSVHRWELDAPGRVQRPRDNNARLGYVMTVDPDGDQAAERAASAVRSLRLHLPDGAVVAPLSPA